MPKFAKKQRMDLLQQLAETTEFLRKNGVDGPELGIVLGTGLGKIAGQMKTECTMAYDEIPHFASTMAKPRFGRLHYGTLAGRKTVVMQGRFHYYEGLSMQQVTYPIRVLKQLGVQRLLLAGTAGSLHTSWRKGSLMLLSDHINLMPDNPLRGRNYDSLGPRFPDMGEAYSASINKLIREEAHRQGMELKEGVYVAVMGPNLETPAEYRFLRKIGADAVGMGTVPEVIVAKHMDLPCSCVVVLTDECDPDNLQPVDIADIIRVAGEAENRLVPLFKNVIERL